MKKEKKEPLIYLNKAENQNPSAETGNKTVRSKQGKTTKDYKKH